MNRSDLIEAMKATASAPPKKFNVKGWGDIFIKPLTVEQCDLQQQEPDTEGKDRLRFARGAARLICDEKGELLFDPENAEDLELLAKQPWELLRKVIARGGEENATSEAGSAEVKKG
jgi:hypothetical protein